MEKTKLSQNLIYKLVAVFLALVLWFNAWDQQNPIIEEVFNVPLEVRELPPSLVVAKLPENVQVRVEGRKNIISEISSRDFHAYVNLKKAEKGEHDVDVKVEVPPGVHLVNITPSKVSVGVDERSEIQLPVVVEIEGNVSPGYKALEPFVEPSEAVISGPKSLLSKVETVSVKVSLSGERDDYVRTLPIMVDGEDLGGRYQVTVSPQTAKVFIPVVPEGAEKVVPVEAVLTGRPAAGYEVGRVVVHPSKMKIFGSREVLERVEYIRTYPLDVTGREDDFTANVGLRVPESVDVSAAVTVDVFVEIRRK